MPSTYSPSLKIELIGTGEQPDQWGSTTNNNFQYAIEQAIAGYVSVAYPSDADYNWGAGYVNSNGAQEQRNLVIYITGFLTALRKFVVPSIEKTYVIINTTTNVLNVCTSVFGSASVLVPSNRTVTVYVDGTNVGVTGDYADNFYVNNLQLLSPLLVGFGGTGANNAPAARVNLGLEIGVDIPSVTGLGATGTWAINILGNAATATNATYANIASLAGGITGGFANGLVVQTASNTTGFVSAPSPFSTNYYLKWNGTNIDWAQATATYLEAGAANQIPVQSNVGVTTFIAAPTAANTALSWTGSAFSWAPTLIPATTVGGLPAAATAGVGARSFVTDSSVTTFGTALAGGGANKVPVYSDGAAWYVG